MNRGSACHDASARGGNGSCHPRRIVNRNLEASQMQERAGVGSSVVIKGELIAHEDVVIAGRVEGLINVTGHLVVVEAGAHVAGDITAAGIVVAGSVEGSLIADERITVQNGADLQGDVAAPRVAVADGAVVNGRIETVAAAAKPKLKVAS
jgi:cytoskeletal protein CcmA (bactofilin family)